MDMSKDEIVVRYRQAKHKAEQIKILADLNACGVDDIIQVLTDSGINLRGMNKVRGKLSAIQDEPIPASVEDVQPIPEEPVEDAEPTQPIPEPTAIDNALDVIRNQIREIDASISVLNQRKQAIIDKLRDIFSTGTES
jgi:hypothetical protein